MTIPKPASKAAVAEAPADETVNTPDETVPEPQRRPASSGWRMLVPTMTPWLALGMFLIVGITLFGIIGPHVVGDPAQIRNQGLTPPSTEFLLGTTQTGQDVLAQLAYSTRGSLQIGALAGVLATLIAAFFGIYGAYHGRAVDEIFALITNVFLVIPGLPLVIVISGFVPQESRGVWALAVVLAITGWAASARVLRAQTLSVRNRDFVAASQVAGERPWRVITVEILPNLLPVLAAQFVFTVIAAILGEAGLSFIGLGANGSTTLGTMLFFAQNGFALGLGAWWWFVPPGLMIALFGMGLSLVNFSIDEIINPKLKNLRQHRKRARRAARLESELARRGNAQHTEGGDR